MGDGHEVPDVKQFLSDQWIEETFKSLILPHDLLQARRLLARMQRLIGSAICALTPASPCNKPPSENK